MLICPLVHPFHVIHESAVYHLVAPWGGEVAGEIPVACVVGAGFVDVVNRLVDYLHLGINEMIFSDYRNLARDFIIGELVI